MNLTKIRDKLEDRITSPFIGILSRTGITPNALTLIGLAISLAAAYVVAVGHFFIGWLLVLLSGLFDLLDGTLASFNKQATNFGAILDSTVDRISEAAIFLGLLFYFMSKGSNLEIILIFLVVVGSFLVSYVRARAEGLDLECKAGWFTRAERIVVLTIGLLLNQIPITLWILAVFIYVTVFQRLNYLRKT
jgi:CDP-diacylglycerol--glycerol-3-phosphate 3-phosphatidyltransferase